MKKILKTGALRLSHLTILFVAVVVLATQFNHSFWQSEKRIIAWDVISYYAYLPATFIYDDITLEFTKNYQGNHKFVIWSQPTPTGKQVIKTSMGLSFLYAPFFFAGHGYALASGYDAGGYSLPYRFALSMSTVFYMLIGLFFLRKLLLRHFSERVTALTLLAITLGTNLFYYLSLEPTAVHSYNFALFAVFAYATVRFYEKPKLLNSFLTGLLFGLIVLIRPTNVLIGLFFLLYGVSSRGQAAERRRFFARHYGQVLLMALAAFLVWVPQLLYWKAISGQWLYFSYNDNESFFFLKPQIFRGLFGYRKGWLLYTPMMILALAGIPLLWKKARKFFFPVLLFFLLNVYIILSWWSWWYGGSFGLRAFIESYALLAIPLAAFSDFCLARKKIWKKALFATAICALIVHSLFQTAQYHYGAIHWDSMSKQAYWDSFGRLKPSPRFAMLLRHPDYEKAKLGIQHSTRPEPPKKIPHDAPGEWELFCTMEKISPESKEFLCENSEKSLENAHQSDENAFSGNFAAKLSKENPFGLDFRFAATPGERYQISAWRKGDTESYLVVSGSTAEVFYQTQNQAQKTEKGWDFLVLNLEVPPGFSEKQLHFYLWNPSKKDVFFDNLKIKKLKTSR